MVDIINKKEEGFTLIELMIVIAIIGILAAIAIPNFLRFQAKSKQAEAKTNLGALGTTAEAYRTEEGTYGATITQLGWQASGSPRYDYGYNATAINYTNSKNSVVFDVAAQATAVTATTFVAAAEGDVDGEPAGEDCWTYDQGRTLTNTTNDVIVDTAC